MTRGGIQEYVAAIRERYFGGAKKEKTKILDEFTRVTGRHRKSAIRLLRRATWSACWPLENAPPPPPHPSQ